MRFQRPRIAFHSGLTSAVTATAAAASSAATTTIAASTTAAATTASAAVEAAARAHPFGSSHISIAFRISGGALQV